MNVNEISVSSAVGELVKNKTINWYIYLQMQI